MNALPRILLALAAVAGSATPAAGQQIPWSQRAATIQMVASAEITIRYSRPVARGRRLFGGVVRWGRPWNPGADTATSITVSTAARIEGRTLPAGSYTMWVIPDSAGAWTVIFSRAYPAFHTPYPGEAHDQLRVPARPATGSHMETLAFYFPLVSGPTATLHLHWGTTVLPLRIEVDP